MAVPIEKCEYHINIYETDIFTEVIVTSIVSFRHYG